MDHHGSFEGFHEEQSIRFKVIFLLLVLLIDWVRVGRKTQREPWYFEGKWSVRLFGYRLDFGVIRDSRAAFAAGTASFSVCHVNGHAQFKSGLYTCQFLEDIFHSIARLCNNVSRKSEALLVFVNERGEDLIRGSCLPQFPQKNYSTLKNDNM